MSIPTRVAVTLLVGWVSLVAVLPLVAAEAATPGAAPIDEAASKRGEVYALLMRALMAQRRGEYRSATADLRRATELEPDSPAVLVQAAELLERMGRLREAEDLARRALALDESDVDSLTFVADRIAARVLGANKVDPKSRDEALDLYERLLAAGVDDPEVTRKVVALRLQAGDEQGALAAAEALVARRPGDRQAVGMLGQLLVDSGQPRRALRVLVTFIADHPNDSALIRLAEDLARDLDAWDVVEEVFAGSAGFEERAVEAQRLRGEALLRLDRVEPASRALEKLLLADPTDRNVRYHLARIYRRMGRLGEAARLARGLAEEGPTDRGAHLLLAEVLDDQADVEGALNAYTTVVRLFASDEDGGQAQVVREAVRRRMIMLYLLGDQTAAAARMSAELELPDEPEALQIRARIAVERSDWNEVRQTARKLRAAGGVADAALLEAEANLRDERSSRASAKIAEAVEQGGDSARLRAASLYLDVGLADDGRRLLQEWVDREPGNPDAHFQFGGYLYRAGSIEESEREMREVIRLAPDHAQALNFLGYSFAERGVRLEEALELIERALRLDPWNGAYLDSLGWVRYRLGRFEEAREAIEQAARTFPHDPTVLDHLGDIYVKVGERKLALAAWARAIDAGAEDPGALRAKIEVVEVAEKNAEASGQQAKPLPEGLPWR